jgi:type II secretory pathway pseudopilin PulG
MKSLAIQRQRGFTLPEFMIGVSASLAVMSMALMAYSAAQQQIERLEQTTQAQWQEQVALRHLLANVRLAGGVALPSASQQMSAGESTFGNRSTAIEVQTDISQDTLGLGYASNFWTTDCLGSAQGKNDFIMNHFKISAKKELTCKDTAARTSSGYQALADDVLEMRIKLAISSADGQGLRWIGASAYDANRSPHVQALQVCLRLKTPDHWPLPLQTQQDCLGKPLPANAPAQRIVQQVMVLAHRQ